MDTVSAALPVVWHDAPTTVADGVTSPRWDELGVGAGAKLESSSEREQI